MGFQQYLEGHTRRSCSGSLLIWRNFNRLGSWKKPIRDVLTWVQCFNIYIAVVAKKHPDMVPEMLAYMLIVLRAQREYEEPAWRLYDGAFWDKAAATGNRKWSQINMHIYNQIFTGRARKRVLCTHCSTATHETEECSTVQPRRKQRVEEAPFRSVVLNFEQRGTCIQYHIRICSGHYHSVYSV